MENQEKKNLFENEEARRGPCHSTSEWAEIENNFRTNGKQGWGRISKLPFDNIVTKNERGERCPCGRPHAYVEFHTAVGVDVGRAPGCKTKRRFEWQEKDICRDCAHEFVRAYGVKMPEECEQ